MRIGDVEDDLHWTEVGWIQGQGSTLLAAGDHPHDLLTDRLIPAGTADLWCDGVARIDRQCLRICYGLLRQCCCGRCYLRGLFGFQRIRVERSQSGLEIFCGGGGKIERACGGRGRLQRGRALLICLRHDIRAGDGSGVRGRGGCRLGNGKILQSGSSTLCRPAACQCVAGRTDRATRRRRGDYSSLRLGCKADRTANRRYAGNCIVCCS